MGRRKITIKQIPDVKLRHITFNKRKNGLFKKAAELSVLCNLNLLLVCEDGLGNLIRFSKNRITDINSFISQCNYQQVIDLTSEDYPDFTRINRKKDKDQHEESESGLEDEPSVQTKEENTTPYAPIEIKQKPSTKTRSKPVLNLTTTPEDRTGSQRQKNKGASTVPADDIASQTSGGLDSVQKKNKNRLNLRLKIPKQEGVPETQTSMVNETAVRMPSTNVEQNNMVSDRTRKPSDNLPMRGMERNEFASPSFIPFGDNLKRYSGIYDSSTSPFKLYSQNARMEPLSSVLKGLSPFTFPITGTPLVRQGYGEGGDDRFPETALKAMGRSGMGPETGNSATSNKVFTFQHEDSMPMMNQMSTRNDYVYGNQRHMQNAIQMQGQLHDYINLPSATMKSEPDFDINMPPDTLSARRFNFDGYFKDPEDGGYSDLRKKYKMT